MSTVNAATGASAVICRHAANPILQAADVPYPATLVFNAGVCKWNGKYIMIFRNDFGDASAKRLDGHNLGLATSPDGTNWHVAPKPVYEADDRSHPLWNAYDPRLTVIENRLYLCFATGGRWGTAGGVAVTDDLVNWEVLSISVPDNRNFTLFPQRFDGRLVRMERPFAGYLRPSDRFDIWMSASPDGRYWGDSRLVLETLDFPWVNNKIGPGTPPILTDRGWLTMIHTVDVDDARPGGGWSGDWIKRYTAALVLLDRHDPYKVIGISHAPVLVPDEAYPWETSGGYRDGTVFPGAMILEDDGEVKIYYGCSDTVQCLATAQIDDLLALCKPFTPPNVYMRGAGPNTPRHVPAKRARDLTPVMTGIKPRLTAKRAWPGLTKAPAKT